VEEGGPDGVRVGIRVGFGVGTDDG
jgi:hypothetical protein